MRYFYLTLVALNILRIIMTGGRWVDKTADRRPGGIPKPSVVVADCILREAIQSVHKHSVPVVDDTVQQVMPGSGGIAGRKVYF